MRVLRSVGPDKDYTSQAETDLEILNGFWELEEQMGIRPHPLKKEPEGIAELEPDFSEALDNG